MALVAALGGTSYAATQVASAQIKNNSIKSVDVKNRSLTGKDVKSNSLGGAQVRESKLGKVPSAARADSARMAGSAQHAAVAQNAATADSATSVDLAATAQSATKANTAGHANDTNALGGRPLDDFVRSVSYVDKESLNNSTNVKSVNASCPAGRRAISGGAWLDGNPAYNVAITDTGPTDDGGWSVRAVEVNATASNWLVTIEVVCAGI